MSDTPNIPGKELEKAAAGVVTRTAETILTAIGGLFERWAGPGNAKARAEAEQVAKDIALAGEIRRSEVLHFAKHKHQLRDIEYQQELQEKAVGRLRTEWLQEQLNVDRIVDGGIEYANADSSKPKAEGIDEDWLLRFFQYAAKVDDSQLQNVMAKALADAAVADRPLTSNRAIDTIRFLDRSTYEAFRFASRELALFELVPPSYFYMRERSAPAGFELTPLTELGLIKLEQRKSMTLPIGGVSFQFIYAPSESFQFELISLTKIGREIGALIHPEIRSRFPTGESLITGSELWRIQLSLQVSDAEVKALAISGIQEMSDRSGIAYDITAVCDKPPRVSVGKGERNSVDDPFNLKLEDPGNLPQDERQRAYAEIVLHEFEDFDTNQLPNFITDAFSGSR